MNGVQVRNLYFVKNLVTSGELVNPGDLKVVPSTIKLSGKEAIQLKYMNPDRDVIVSDFIVKETASTEVVAGKGKALKKAVLKLAGDLVAGEDYVVDILVHNYQTISDNSTLSKFGVTRARSGMTKHEFMFKLAKSFALNFRRDEAINKFFKFYVVDEGATPTAADEVRFDTAAPASYSSAAKEIVIAEVEQMTWIRGMFPKQTVSFDVAPHTVIEDGDEIQPFVTVGDSGLVAIVETSTIIPNGYDMADLEYLCHGEIGDQIREVGYPRNIRTKYSIADADVTKMFDAVEITFYYVGRNTSSQKAEKQITLAVDHAGSISASDLEAALGIKPVAEVLADQAEALADHEERIEALEGAGA